MKEKKTNSSTASYKSCTRDHSGRLHSYDDKPAIVYTHDTKVWYKYGKIHREDGPAIEWVNGDMQFYLNNKCYRFDVWIKETPVTDEQRLELIMKYG